MSIPPVYAEIITRLRDRAPLFERRVGGTAAFEQASDAAREGADVPVPQAWVVPLHETAARPSDLGEAQLVTERFGVIVCLSNGTDRQSGLGLIASDVLRAARQEMLNALLPRRNMWAPEADKVWLSTPGKAGCYYVGARHLMQNRARIWHQFEWEIDYYVSYDETEDACVPLREAYLRIGVHPFPPPPGTEGFRLWWPETPEEPSP